MFASLDAPLSAAPSPRPADPRAARLAKFKREQRIVEYLNRGVAVAEIAAQVGLSEKRMHAVVRDILDRRMPHPPKEFVAIQASRLNEALLVAYSAMSLTNLKAVDQVVKIVRELDRYHGLSAGAGRRRFEPDALAAPDEATVAYGGAFVCRAEWAAADDEDLALAGADARPENPPEAIEKIDSAPGEIETSPATQNPLALPGLLTRGSRGEGRGEGPGRLAAESHPAPHPSLLPVNGEKGRAAPLPATVARKFRRKPLKRLIPRPGHSRLKRLPERPAPRGAPRGTRRPSRPSNALRPLDRRAPAGLATTVTAMRPGRASQLLPGPTIARNSLRKPLKRLIPRPGAWSLKRLPARSSSRATRGSRAVTRE